MRSFLFAFAFFIVPMLMAQRMDWFARTSSNGSNTRTFTAVDPDGNSFLAGEFSGTITVGNSTFSSSNPEDVVLAKIDPSGNVLWAEQFGSGNDDQILSMAADEEGGLVIGIQPSGFSTVFQAADTTITLPVIGPRSVMLRIAPDGAVLRTRLFNDIMFDVAGTDVYNATKPTLDGWVLERLDGDLQTVWTASLGTFDAYVTSVDVNPAGYIVLSATEYATDAMTIQGVDVPNDPVDANEAIVVRFDLEGAVQWVRTFGAQNSMAERVRGSAVGDDGRVYIATGSDTAFAFAGGAFPFVPGHNAKVGFLLAYNADGTEDWAIPAYTHFDQATFWDVIVDADGQVVSSADLVDGGLVNGLTVPEISRPFGLLKTDPQGSTIWLKHPDASGPLQRCPAFDLGQGPDGAYYLGGFGQFFQLDCVPLPNTGWNYYVLRIVEEPMVVPEAAFTWSSNGLDVQFDESSANAAGWSWDLGDGSSSTEPDPFHTYPGNGTYVVTLTATLGWCTSVIADTLVLISTDTEALSGAELLRAWPNPASTEIRFALPTASAGGAELRILDAMGRCVLLQRLNTDAPAIPLVDLAAGRYCAQVVTPSWRGRAAFVVE